MTRNSIAEMYDDKDVITQICKLKDTVNSYAGGIISDMEIVGDDLVVTFADGTQLSLPLPSPTGISSITGSISGTNLTITIYMTDGSSHAFTCPLNGIATEDYVDTKDAQNVKLTGDQTIAGVKTFTGSANVPTAPADLLGASAVNEAYVNDATEGVNNILHKSGDETKSGKLCVKGTHNTASYDSQSPLIDKTVAPGSILVCPPVNFRDKNGQIIGFLRCAQMTDKTTAFFLGVLNSDGTEKQQVLLRGDVI